MTTLRQAEVAFTDFLAALVYPTSGEKVFSTVMCHMRGQPSPVKRFPHAIVRFPTGDGHEDYANALWRWRIELEIRVDNQIGEDGNLVMRDSHRANTDASKGAGLFSIVERIGQQAHEINPLDSANISPWARLIGYQEGGWNPEYSSATLSFEAEFSLV